MFDNTFTKTAAQLLLEIILTRYAEYQAELAHLETYANKTCTGTLYWRDNDQNGKTPKLYVNHGRNQACPLHGKPKSGKRLRVYIGTKLEEQRAAKCAIQQEQARTEVAKLVSEMENALADVKSELRGALASLCVFLDGENTPTLKTWPRPKKPSYTW